MIKIYLLQWLRIHGKDSADQMNEQDILDFAQYFANIRLDQAMRVVEEIKNRQ